MVTDVDLLVGRVLSKVFARPEFLTVSRWADQYRVVDGRASAMPGRWSTDRAPYLRGIMDAFNSTAGQISLMKAEQVGGTEALFNIVGYIIDRQPGPMLYVYPSQEIARQVNKKRLLPNLKGSPAVRRHFSGRPYDETSMEISVDRMDLYFAGAGQDSERNLEGKPCRFVFVDELDRCLEGGDIIGVVSGRLTTYRGAGGKLIVIGRPDMAGIGIDREFVNGDQRRYWVPCPSCGQFHTRLWKYVRWEGGSGAPPAQVARLAWMECPHCAARIEGHDNRWQLLQGVWLREGETIESSGAIVRCDPDTGPALSRLTFEEARAEPRMNADGHGSGEDVDSEGSEETRGDQRRQETVGSRHSGFGPSLLPLSSSGVSESSEYGSEALATLGVRINSIGPEGDHASFHLTGLMHALVANPYGHVAGDFVKNGARATKDWTTRRLGEAWQVEAERVEGAELEPAAVAVARGGYAAGVAPEKTHLGGPGPIVCVVAVDIQKDSAWWAVLGYGAGGRDKWLLEFGHTIAPRGGNLRELDFLFSLALPMSGAGDKSLAPVAWTVDTGHRADEAIEWCRRGRTMGRRCIPVKGRDNMVRPHEVHHLDKYPDGRKIEGGLPLLNVNVGYFKERLMAAIKRQGDEAACNAAGRLFLPDPETFNDHATCGMYIAQVTAEHLVIIPDRNEVRRGGRPSVKHEWRKKPGVRDNHALDLNVYADAVVDAMGIRQTGITTGVTAVVETPEAEPRETRREDPERAGRIARMQERMRLRKR